MGTRIRTGSTCGHTLTSVRFLTRPASEIARSENIKQLSERGTTRVVPNESRPRVWTTESAIQFCTVSLRISRIEYVDIPAEYSLEGPLAGLELTVYLAGTVTKDGSVN